MLLSALQKKITNAKRNWEVIKSELETDSESELFLSESYLVLANRFVQVGVVEFENGLHRIVIDNPSLLKRTRLNMNLNSLWRKSEPGNSLNKGIGRIDWSALEFVEDLNVEVRFPTLKMDLIQRMKKHRLVDSLKTYMSPSSIVVVLRS